MQNSPTILSPPASRNADLDVLRGVAVLLVLFNHMPYRSGDWFTGILHTGGWTGVDMFFVLSGYLISGLLFREIQKTGTIAVGRFLLRRGMKIWPSYLANYLCWTLWWCGALWIGHHDLRGAIDHLLSSWPNLVFIQNYHPWDAVLWPSSWSLAVEEHFYLGLPLLLLALVLKRRLKLLPYICAAVIVGDCALRLWLSVTSRQPFWMSIYMPTHLRIDALAFGVLLGYFHHFHRAAFSGLAQRIKPLLPVAAALPLLLVTQLPPETSIIMGPLELSISFLLYGLLVMAAAVDRDLFPAQVTAPLRRLGVFSYTTYLTQSVVTRIPGVSGRLFGFLDRVGGIHLQQLAFFTVAIASGVALSIIVEQPFLRLREKRMPAKQCPDSGVPSVTTLRLPERPVCSIAPGKAVERP